MPDVGAADDRQRTLDVLGRRFVPLLLHGDETQVVQRAPGANSIARGLQHSERLLEGNARGLEIVLLLKCRRRG